MLPKINPTHTKAWEALQTHKDKAEYKANIEDVSAFRLALEDLSFDFSLQNWNEQTLGHLLDLAKETKLTQAIEAMFTGKPINETENRAVLHTALRDFNAEAIYVEGENIIPAIQEEREKIKAFSQVFQTGALKGSTGKAFQHIVNIGIGGSSIGPQFVIDALKPYKQTEADFHFIDSIDGAALKEVLDTIDLERTLFLVVSKTFSTQETMTNAEVVKELLVQELGADAIAQHMIAITTDELKAKDFGISKIFLFWDWVCGRFSLSSSVGLVVAMAIGYEHYEAFLKGAAAADTHFRTQDFKNNIPVLNALVGIWNVNFLGAQTQAILPYNKALGQLTRVLQQAAMESNGKSVDRNGEYVNYATCPIIWGELGNEAQHSFFQLLHQGTHLVPMDFILVEKTLHDFAEHNHCLQANFKAQILALSKGRNLEDTLKKFKEEGVDLKDTQVLHSVFAGNKPLSQIRLKELTPYSLALLLTSYEHTYFVQGILWNIFSFDQWGVELGKSLVSEIDELLIS